MVWLWPETGPVDGPGALGRCAIKNPGPDNQVKGIRFAAPARLGSQCDCGAACLSENAQFTNISFAIEELAQPVWVIRLNCTMVFGEAG